MRSFTDVFIRHPVLAAVVNLVIVLVGWRALTHAAGAAVSPDRELIGAHHHGLLRRQRRDGARLPHHADRAGGVGDQRRGLRRVDQPAGVSTITVRLKLNHNSTSALAEVTARLQQVRSELPSEAEPPVVEVQRADRPYASFYLSFTSTDAGRAPRITDWLAAHAAAAARDAARRAAGDDRGRPASSRCGSGSIPSGSPRSTSPRATCSAALRRNNYLAAVGQTKGNLVQVNLLANTDLRSAEEFKQPDRRRPGRRNRPAERRGEGRAGRRGGRHGRQVRRRRKASTSACWPLVGVQRDRRGAAISGPRWSGSGRRCPKDIDMQLAYDGDVFMEDALTRSPRRWGRRS